MNPSHLSQDAKKVHDALLQCGLETPFKAHHHSEKGKQEALTSHFKELFLCLNLDLTDPHLKGTPTRLARLFGQELFSGLNYCNFPKLTYFERGSNDRSGLIQIKEIRFTSLCAHHFLPIEGHVDFAYLPHKKLLGLSKFHRVVHFFSKRPQIQERFTQQLCKAFETLLEPEELSVSVKALHHCVRSRGTGCPSSFMETVAALHREPSSEASKRRLDQGS